MKPRSCWKREIGMLKVWTIQSTESGSCAAFKVFDSTVGNLIWATMRTCKYSIRSRSQQRVYKRMFL